MLLVAVLLTAGVMVVSRALRRAPAADAQPDSRALAVNSNEEPTKATSNAPSTAPGTSNLATGPSPVHANYVRQRAAELNALAMKNDSASRDAILAELQNPDPQIRKAALEAAIQTGDRSVVPRLQEIAAQTEDAGEKAEILEAIEYINLPSLSEYLADQRAKMAALGLTNMPAPPTNRLDRRARPLRPAPPLQP